jgi:Secretory lipase
MRTRTRTVATALTGCLAAMIALQPASAVSVTPPTQDPFYSVPAGLAGLPNGTVLASRPVNASFYSLPMPATAWQVKYKTLDNQNQPTADVTTVLVPLAPWLGPGPRPLLSYQVAEDGVGLDCSPSYALQTGLPSLGSNSELETGLIALALLQGWAVTVPDYEGPSSAFLGATGEAHGVLDAIRATRSFGPARVSPAAPVGMWGYSGGAFATSVAAQLQPSYAPELHLAGIALGGEVASIKGTLEDFSGSVLGGALVVGIIGIDRSFPDAGISQYLNAAGQAAMAAGQNDCINAAAIQFPFASLTEYQAAPNTINNPTLDALLAGDSPLGFAGAPSAPVYDYHAFADEYAPLSDDRQLMAQYCTAGVPVDHVEDLVGDHISETITGAPGAIAFLRSRFDGAPVVNNCGRFPTS